jgi:hypothetical protein
MAEGRRSDMRCRRDKGETVCVSSGCGAEVTGSCRGGWRPGEDAHNNVGAICRRRWKNWGCTAKG